MMWYIYKHTSPVGKSYIGQTINIEKRWKPMKYMECKKFFYAIVCYGWNNFTHEILCECNSQKKADEAEVYYIKKYNSIDDGYNSISGGQANHSGTNNPFYGKHHTEESKEKIRQNRKRREFTPEEKAKLKERMTGENNPMYGVSSLSLMTEEQIAMWKLHLSMAHSGGKNPAAKPIIIVDTFTGEETYCEYRRQLKEKIGMSGRNAKKYIGENNLYKGRYYLKEVV